MKYTILFVLAAFILSGALVACSSSKNKQKKDISAERRAATSIDLDVLTNVWKETRSKDDYNGIWNEVENGKTITFLTDGKYTELKPENPICEGTYNAKDKSLEIKHSCNTVPLTYTVEHLSKKKLALAIQGRHGKVIYVYEPVK